MSNLDRWAHFVRSIAGDATQGQIAERSGIDQTTISRWFSGALGRPPSASSVVQFARGYGANVVEALAVAGYITDDEAQIRKPTKRVDLSSVPIDVLASEIVRRAEPAA